MTFPIIRVRIYSDLNTIQKIVDNSDILNVSMNFNAGVYLYDDKTEDSQLSIVNGGSNISINMKVYIEMKNVPTSQFDQYENGILRKNNLNEHNKIPFEFFCYDENMIHSLQKRVPSVYKHVSLETVVSDILTKSGFLKVYMDPFDNQTRYTQILLPNLNVIEALTYLDTAYGLYKKGALVFGVCERDGVFSIVNTNTNNGKRPVPIYVKSYKSNSDMVGLMRMPNNEFAIIVRPENVSVLTETNIEKTLNGDTINSVNISTLKTDYTELNKLYNDESIINNTTQEKIITPDILHKYVSNYTSSMSAARIQERVTRIDVSCTGVDIGNPFLYQRFNLIFESPIRGLNINEIYRPINVCHVLTNMDGNKFTSQTTMTLCSN